MSLQEKIIKYQEENTPAPDKLAHYYWGDKWWAAAGTIIALIIILVFKIWFSINLWLLPLAILPYLTARFAGVSKEKRDGTGLGNVEKKDISYTVKPSYKHCLLLILIILL